MTTPAPVAKIIDDRYQGVGGWLLFLCVIMVIISPLWSLQGIVSVLGDIWEVKDQYPGLMLVTAVDLILSAGVIAFQIYAGLKLWRVRPGAAQTAKKYFIVFLVYSFIAAFLPFLAGFSKEGNDIIAAELPKSIFGSLVWFCVWYGYLSVSKRVKTTYKDTAPLYDAEQVVGE